MLPPVVSSAGRARKGREHAPVLWPAPLMGTPRPGRDCARAKEQRAAQAGGGWECGAVPLPAWGLVVLRDVRAAPNGPGQLQSQLHCFSCATATQRLAPQGARPQQPHRPAGSAADGAGGLKFKETVFFSCVTAFDLFPSLLSPSSPLFLPFFHLFCLDHAGSIRWRCRMHRSRAMALRAAHHLCPTSTRLESGGALE